MPTSPLAVVIDDEAVQRSLITALLQREGLRVEAHGSAGEALEAMDPARPPVLVVTALQLPGVDGWKFCRLLRSPEFAAFNAVPVLVISGTFAGPETSRLMAEWGVDAFIPLPVDPATFSCQVQGLLQGERLTKRARVLLVEDSRSQAAFLRATFVDAGWEADTAGTLEEAREAFGREIYDVAVLDYHLPDGTGDALLAAFRRERPDCICLMMTPDPEPGLALAWMRQGAADYLRKPFDPQFLLERCARARRERTLLGLEERLEERTRQLRVSEARLRATLDQTPNVAVQMYDAEGRVTYWNPAAETLYGWKGEEVLGRTLDTFLLGPEEAAQFRRVFADCAETGQPFGPYEILTQRQDGREVWVLATTFAIPSEGGPPTFVCMDVDITRRKLAQAELQAKHEELERYFEQGLDLHSIGDSSGRLLRVNPAWESILGYSKADVTGRLLLDLIHPEDRKTTLRAFAELGRGNSIHGLENRYRCRDGSYRWIEWRAWTVGTTVCGVGRDVTARREAEERIAALLRFRDQMLDTATVWIDTLDPEGRVTLWNRAAEAISGYAREDVLGNSRVWEWLYPDPQYRQEIFAEATRILQEGRRVEGLETTIRRKDGETRIISWFSNPIADEEGTTTGSIALGLDVTERRRAEEALKRSETRFDTVLQAVNEGIWDWDLATGEAYFSPQGYRMLGYEPGAFPADFEHWRSLLHPDDFAEREARLAESLAQGRDFEMELRLRTREGGWKWILARGSVVERDEQGKPRRIVGSHIDITEWREAQERLRLSEARFAAAEEAVNDGIWEWDLSTNRTYFSPNYFRMLGYAPGAFPSHADSWRALIHPEDRSRVDAVEQAALEAGQGFAVEQRLRCQDGRWKWVLSRGQIVERDAAGRPLRMLGTHMDITERREAEDALRQSEARFTAAVEAVNDGIWTWDLRTGQAYFSPLYYRMLGYEPGAFPADYDHWKGLLHPEDQPRVEAILESSIAEGRSFDVDMRLRCQDGSYKWIRGRGRIIETDTEGHPLRMAGTHVDITERKALEESLHLFRRLVAHSTEAIGISTPEGRHFYQNEAFDRLFGMVGEDPSTTAYQDPAVGAMVFRTLMAGGQWQGEVQMRGADGSIREVYLRAYPILAPDGRVLALVGLHSDITDRKRAQAARREIEARLRALSDNLPAGMVYQLEAGADGQTRDFTYLSAGVEKLHGVTAAEARRDPGLIYSQVIEEDRPRLVAAEAEANARLGTLREELRVRMPDGSLGWRLFTSEPRRMPDGKVLWDGVELDITEQKEQSLQIQREREWSSRLLKLAPDLVVGLGEDARILLFNQFAETLTGYRAEEVLGQSWIEAFIPESERGTIRKVWADVVGAQRIAHQHENRILTRSGEERLIRWSNTVISEDGRFQMVLSIGADVTEARRMEAERLELERRLLHSQKLESLGVLAGGIAHDFNNLLMAMLGNLELALMDLSPLSSARGPLGQIESIVHRASDLTRQMLAYSGRGAFQIQPMDLNALVQENVHLFRAAVSRNVSFRLDLAPDPAWILADPGQVQQVIMNLVTNASEAIGDRMGVVSLSTRERPVESAELIRSRCSEIPAPGRFVELQVMDTGCGMEPDVLDRIFDPFFTTKFTGRGLGMSAILGIVQGHRGAILVESTPGQGTAARVFLPALEASPRAEPALADDHRSRPLVDEIRGTRGTIVLVDDEEILRQTEEILLERLGFTVRPAEDGLAALEILKDPPPDLVGVILDLTMPGLDGLGTLEALRHQHPDLPVLLCSGFDRNETLAKVSDTRKVGFLQKPFRLKDLERSLEQMLGAG